jgi:glycine hydroxymethyltransferase
MARNGDEGDGQIEQRVRDRVAELCDRFPIYPEL